MPDLPTPLDRYRAVLQAIALGKPHDGRPLSANDAQQLARRVLIEMGDDWTERGAEAVVRREARKRKEAQDDE